MSLTTGRHNGRLVCTVVGSGDVTRDKVNLTSAATLLSDEGIGTLEIYGTCEFDEQIRLDGSIKLLGMNDTAKLVSHMTSGQAQIVWNGDKTFPGLISNPFDITATAMGNHINALDADVNAAIGRLITRGEWVIIWSEDQIPGVHPHSGPGRGQHPLALFQVAEVFTDLLRIDGINPDEYTAAANAKGVVVDLVPGIVIDNLRFDHAIPGGTAPPDFSDMIRIYSADNPVITSSCKVLRNGGGAIRFSHCANAKAYCDVMGAANATTTTYGYTVDAVNGAYVEAKVDQCRHAVDTISTQSLNDAFTVTAVNINPTNSLSFASAHNLDDGTHVIFETSAADPPAGLAEDTPYWVVGGTTLTLQLATTPGGSPVTITDAGSGTHTVRRQGRWGTPLGLVARGLHIMGPYINAGPSYADHSGLSTHSEGWGPDISMDVVLSADDAVQTGGIARARATRFHNMRIIGGSTEATNTSIGLKLAASDCVADNVVFQGIGTPVQFQDNGVSGQTEVLNNCSVINCVAIDCTGDIRILEPHANTTISCDFRRSGTQSRDTPYQNKSLISYLTTQGGHRVIGRGLFKDGNDFSIDIGQLDETELQITGCDLTGYGSATPGIGRYIELSAAFTNDVIRSINSHGLSVDDKVQFITAGAGTYPPSTPQLASSTDYFVTQVSSNTDFKVSDTLGGADVDITGSFTPQLFVMSAALPDMETEILGRNHVDP